MAHNQEECLEYFNKHARYMDVTGRYVIRYPEYSASGLMADADLDKLLSKFKRVWNKNHNG